MEEPKIEDKMLGEIQNSIAFWIANERHGFGDITQEDWNGLTECDRQSIWQNAEVEASKILPIISRYCVIPEEGELPKDFTVSWRDYDAEPAIVWFDKEALDKAGYGKYRKIEI